ncbi:MAG: hypothetical protein WEB89_03425 [Balneolales bacterium]
MEDKPVSTSRKIVSRTWALVLLVIVYLLVIKPVSITLHDIAFSIMEDRVEVVSDISIHRKSRSLFVITQEEFTEGISLHIFGGYLYIVPAAMLFALYNERRHIWVLLGLHAVAWLLNMLFLFAGISGLSFMLYVCDIISRYMINISLFYLLYVIAINELKGSLGRLTKNETEETSANVED